MASSLADLRSAAAELLAEVRPLIPMYIHLILSALFPIYAGAHASLSRPSSAAPPEKKDLKDFVDEDEDEEDEMVQKMEGLTPTDAIVFPVMAAAVLAGLYFLIKTYEADLINLILGWYFSGVGVYSVARLVNDAASFLLGFVFPSHFAHGGKLWKVHGGEREAVLQGGTADAVPALKKFSPLPWPSAFSAFMWRLRAAVKQLYTTEAYVHDIVDIKVKVTIPNLLSVAASIATIAYANLVAKPWWLTNLQGFAVCYSGLQFMSPTTFFTGTLILSGLFFYDIWAVFFTPLMVTVAKNLDQPIKLVFPRPDEPNIVPGEPMVKSFSMLGLGDIVLPGLMIGLALRFDLYMFYLKKQQRVAGSTSDDDSSAPGVTIQKAPYVPVTGRWGDGFWTARLPAPARPAHLRKSFPKPYFVAAMVGYVVGMLTTLGVMTVFQHAQPALLYLVPGVLISLWGTGVVRGEAKEMWDYTEAVTGEAIEADDSQAPGIDKEKAKAAADDSSVLFAKREVSGVEGSKKDEPRSAPQDASEKSSDADRPPTSDVDAPAESPRRKDLVFSFTFARYSPQRRSGKAIDQISSITATS